MATTSELLVASVEYGISIWFVGESQVTHRGTFMVPIINGIISTFRGVS